MGKRLISFAIIALCAQPWPVKVMASGASTMPPAVVDASQASSPIQVLQAQLLQGDDGTTHLWFAYRNRSDGVIARFEISATFSAANGRTLASARRVVSGTIGAGESTTAEIPRIALPAGAAKATIAVTRVRFGDLALWSAPPPPPPNVARANADQTIGGRLPVTDVVQPTTAPIPSPASSASPTVANPLAAPAANPVVAAASSPAPPALVPQSSIDLSVSTDENSATAAQGDRVEFTVVRGASAAGNRIIPVGAKGMGHLASVRRAGRFGRSGALTFVPDVVEAADGSFVPLRGSVTIHPPPTVLAVLADLTIVGGFLARGRDAVLPAGSVITATTATGVATNQTTY